MKDYSQLVKDPNVYMESPKSYKENYEKAITAFSWETEDTVELDANEFEKYVLDNWEWKEDFLRKSNLYKIDQ